MTLSDKKCCMGAFVSKLVEHLNRHNLLPVCTIPHIIRRSQSSVVCTASSMISAIDQGIVNALTLLDLSASFDTATTPYCSTRCNYATPSATKCCHGQQTSVQYKNKLSSSGPTRRRYKQHNRPVCHTRIRSGLLRVSPCTQRICRRSLIVISCSIT
jgi:hypothetical protein